MALAGDDDLLDLIYGAAVDPSLWTSALERYADRIGGTSAWLSRLNLVDATGPGIIARIDPAMTSLYMSYYAGVNPLARVEDVVAYKRAWSLRILTDEDWMPKDDLIKTEFYNDFMLPQQSHSALMIRLALRGDEVSALTVNRPLSRGQFSAADLEEANRFHPHLVRAFRMGGIMSDTMVQNADLAEALDRSPQGVLVLDRDGRIRHVNAAGRSLFDADCGLRLVDGRLSGGSIDAERRLSALIGRAAPSDGSQRTGGSMTLPLPGRALPLTIMVSPLNADRLAVFGGTPAVLVMISDPNIGPAPTEAVLRENFGFTPAESRVALGLLGGAKPRQVADRLGVSVHTVRNQLRSVFEKTGATGQSELMLTLMRGARPQ